ncbi:MAG: amino acid adenylation domain-containing protein [Oscillospiraceae bacterium]|nr:amino acid adenylation domain-containing protein [Oscillospiraceae bacterium]
MINFVTQYLDASAITYPDHIAFEEPGKRETFKSFREKSIAIGTGLAKAGMFKSPVLVYMRKGVDCLSAFMGAAYSGNFYTPVDVSTPAERINKIVEVLRPKAIISEEALLENVGELKHDARVFTFEELAAENGGEALIENALSRLIDTDLLYVLFTSGSTGTPKGVAICHRSVIDYTEWVVDTFKIDQADVFGNQAPFYFDNSVLDIYSAMKTGATVNVIPEKKFTFPIELLKYMVEYKINTIFWVPSALCVVANLKALQAAEELPPLKRILFCGEVMPNKQLNVWRRHFKDALFANLYGPTEITDVCTCYMVDREFTDDEPLPIGKPCRNTDILVLTEDNRLAGPDEIGELCVRGSSLAMGYYGNPEKTAEAFVQNPLNLCYPEKIYRTGDLVKYNECGEIMYLSRKDFQIKHRGHRIELGEIETAAGAIPGMETVACLYDTKRSRIVLFHRGKAGREEIFSSLSKKLPEYMIPERFIELEEFPYNVNGKIDRVKLKDYL